MCFLASGSFVPRLPGIPLGLGLPRPPQLCPPTSASCWRHCWEGRGTIDAMFQF